MKEQCHMILNEVFAPYFQKNQLMLEQDNEDDEKGNKEENVISLAQFEEAMLKNSEAGVGLESKIDREAYKTMFE